MRWVWFWAPCWYWHGWRTLLPWYIGGDEYGRRTLLIGWTVTGRAIVAISRPGRLYPPDAELEDYGCCALDVDHGGPCAWRCPVCIRPGACPHCDGEGTELGCIECDSSGSCPGWCDEGWVSDDR